MRHRFHHIALALAAAATPLGLVASAPPVAGAAGPQTSAYVVYVADSYAGAVGQYDAKHDGALVLKEPPLVPAGPGAEDIAVSPDGNSVYVTSPADGVSNGAVAQFDVTPDGALVPKAPATVAAGPGANGIAVSPDGTSAYVTNERSGDVSQYSVAAGGALVPKSPPRVAVGARPFDVAVSRDGTSVYVVAEPPFPPFVNGIVAQYTVGPGGALLPKVPPTVDAEVLTFRVAVGRDGTSVYVTNRSGHISQYTVGPGGALLPKVPPTVAGGGYPGGIAVSPDGHSVYVPNGDGTVSQFTVALGGPLVPKVPATLAAGDDAQAVVVSPDGKSVYVTNDLSADISQYTVGPGGTLVAKSPARVPAGAFALAIAVNPRRTAPPSVHSVPTSPPATSRRRPTLAATGGDARYLVVAEAMVAAVLALRCLRRSRLLGRRASDL